MLPGQMLLWQLKPVQDSPMNLHLKSRQNRVSNSWDITNIEFLWWGGVVCKVIFMSNPTFVELLLHWRWVRVLTKIWSVWKKLWWGSNIFKWLGLSVAPNPECGITQPSSRIAFYNILTSSSSSTISQVAIVGLQKKVGKSRKPLYVNLGGVFFCTILVFSVTYPDCNVDTHANISALFVHNAHAVKYFKYVIATTAVLTLMPKYCAIPY